MIFDDFRAFEKSLDALFVDAEAVVVGVAAPWEAGALEFLMIAARIAALPMRDAISIQCLTCMVHNLHEASPMSMDFSPGESANNLRFCPSF